MSSRTKSSKGKRNREKSSRTSDQSTAWSQWNWSPEHGCWTSWRLDGSGHEEWNYTYPEVTTTGQDGSTPRYTNNPIPEYEANSATDTHSSADENHQRVQGAYTHQSDWEQMPESGSSGVPLPIEGTTLANIASNPPHSKFGKQSNSQSYGSADGNCGSYSSSGPGFQSLDPTEQLPVQGQTFHPTTQQVSSYYAAAQNYPPADYHTGDQGYADRVQEPIDASTTWEGGHGTATQAYTTSGSYPPATPSPAFESSHPVQYDRTEYNEYGDGNQISGDFAGLNLGNDQPEPEPSPAPGTNCNQGGCEFGPQRNPADPTPRAPPSTRRDMASRSDYPSSYDGSQYKKVTRHTTRGKHRSGYSSESEEYSSGSTSGGETGHTPMPKCQHSGCEFGPNRDPDGPSPRPPPSGTSGYSKSYSSSKGRSGNSQRTSKNERRSTHESRGNRRNAGPYLTEGLNEAVGADTDTYNDLATWRKEYETWKDVTCACGFGYYTLYGEWISGEDVRAGKAPPKPAAPELTFLKGSPLSAMAH